MTINSEGAMHQSWAWPTAATKILAVIGDPVAHSLSPVLHNAAIRSLGLDMVYVALPVPKESLGTAIAAARDFGIVGMSVTMPHKEKIIEYLDSVTDRARLLRSVNFVYWEGDKLVGDSVDGTALVNALKIDHDVNPKNKVVAILGSGGGARAISLACAEAGAAAVYIISRNANNASAAAELAGAVGYVGVAADVSGADIVINATPVGMSGTPLGGLSPLTSDQLQDGQFVYDIVYYPLVTPLMEIAIAKGLQCANGVGMLVHSAAVAFEYWSGFEAPIEEMQMAAKAETLRRS